MVFVVVIAIVIPNFGPLLSLVGGSFHAFLGMVCPIVFYWKLTDGLTYATELLLVFIVLFATATAIGNGYVELKNVAKVIQGVYE